MVNKRVIALIPARSRSIRIKDKNIKKLNNIPLIAYTIKTAIDSKIFNRIIVSTDSLKYANLSKKFGAEIPFLRPKKISNSTNTDFEWISYTLNKLLNNHKEYDYFCILRPTSPFRTVKMLKSAWRNIKKQNNADSIRAVELCNQHPFKMWKYKQQIIEPIFKKKINSQPSHSVQYASLPKIYVQNASLEITKISVLKRYKNITGNKIIPFFTKNYEGFDINTPLDWNMAKILMQKKLVKTPFD